jgi:hypothetical protein
MTENDEKLAEELANEYEKKWLCGDKPSFKDGFLAGLAHERAKNKAKRPEEQTVDFGTFKARVEDL